MLVIKKLVNKIVPAVFGLLIISYSICGYAGIRQYMSDEGDGNWKINIVGKSDEPVKINAEDADELIKFLEERAAEFATGKEIKINFTAINVVFAQRVLPRILEALRRSSLHTIGMASVQTDEIVLTEDEGVRLIDIMGITPRIVLAANNIVQILRADQNLRDYAVILDNAYFTRVALDGLFVARDGEVYSLESFVDESLHEMLRLRLQLLTARGALLVRRSNIDGLSEAQRKLVSEIRLIQGILKLRVESQARARVERERAQALNLTQQLVNVNVNAQPTQPFGTRIGTFLMGGSSQSNKQ